MDSITVVFSEDLQLDQQDLVLTNLGKDASQDPDMVVPIEAGEIEVNGNVVTISLGERDLPDGVYQLEVVDTVTSVSGRGLDGDGDQAVGAPFVYTGDADNRFYQLVADFNSDRGVSVFDFPTFSYWFGQAVGVAPAYVDLNRDNGIAIFDFPAFAANFGEAITYAAARPTGNNVDPNQQSDPVSSGDSDSAILTERQLREQDLLQLLAEEWRWQRRQQKSEMA